MRDAYTKKYDNQENKLSNKLINWNEKVNIQNCTSWINVINYKNLLKCKMFEMVVKDLRNSFLKILESVWIEGTKGREEKWRLMSSHVLYLGILNERDGKGAVYISLSFPTPPFPIFYSLSK